MINKSQLKIVYTKKYTKGSWDKKIILNIKHISLSSENEEKYFFLFLKMEGEDIKNEGRNNKFLFNFFFLIT